MHFFLIVILYIASKTFASPTYYIHNTDECKIPAFHYFSQEANEIYQSQEYQSCPKSDLVSFTRVQNNTAYLHLSHENTINHKSEDPPICCYSYVARNGSEEEPDVGISLSECIFFNETVKLEQQTVYVKCEKNSIIVHENVHNPIIITEPVQKKLEENHMNNSEDIPISILFVVIDSMSRLNFRRTMTKTRKFVLENNFTEFKAYNKIDDNTFPNCMALLTGMSLRQVYSICPPKEVGKLDECPMIWYNFRDLGYVTAYAEDWADYATFNYQIKGFKEPPTDYYFKPYIEAGEVLLNKTEKENMVYCTGPETEAERIMNLAKDFAVTFKNKPSFGIFWMNTFSHNNINTPTSMDAKVAHFFEKLQTNGILRKSIVILLSDHGIRFGKFRQTIQGWFEERLPMNYISIPPWLQYKYPSKYNNFLENANKLISTYDLYMTLQDLLKMQEPTYNITPSAACPRCQSLFTKIKPVRSCADAGISEAWCTCVGKFTSNDPRITEETNNKAVQLALEKIIKLGLIQSYKNASIISSSVNMNRLRKSYLLLVLQVDNDVYQVLFRIRGDPVDFVRIVKVMKLY